MPALIEADKIIRELNDLWKQLDTERSQDGGVLRACALTLVVTTPDTASATEVRGILGEIMNEHPCRAVVIKMHDGGAEEPSARVFAECRMPFGSQQQICSEGVEIIADPSRFEEVAQALVPLRVSDLPMVLWCRGTDVFSLRAFDHLFPMVDKLIFDSSKASNPTTAQGFLRSLRRRGLRVGDLHWTRLTGWREIVSHLFADRQLQISDVNGARVVHGGGAPSSCALYFASWIGQALPSVGVQLEAAPSERGGLRGVFLATTKGEISVQKAEGGGVEVCCGGFSYRSSLPPRDEASLMREELKILGPDPVFEKVLG